MPPVFRWRAQRTDIKEILVRVTGELETGDVAAHLIDTLSNGGFLENEAFERIKEERHRDFAARPQREAIHAGVAYPSEISPLRATCWIAIWCKGKI